MGDTRLARGVAPYNGWQGQRWVAVWRTGGYAGGLGPRSVETEAHAILWVRGLGQWSGPCTQSPRALLLLIAGGCQKRLGVVGKAVCVWGGSGGYQTVGRPLGADRRGSGGENSQRGGGVWHEAMVVVGVQSGQNFPLGGFGAHGLLREASLATNCWLEAPQGGRRGARVVAVLGTAQSPPPGPHSRLLLG